MGGSLSRFKVAAVSVGRRNQEGSARRPEDAYRIAQGRVAKSGEQFTVIALADGAGSAARGRTGADIACLIACEVLRDVVEQDALCVDATRLKEQLMTRIWRTIRRAASRSKLAAGEYASTLLAVAVTESGKWLAVHIGDGAILGRFGDQVLPISLPMKGRYAHETYFVTQRDARRKLRVLSQWHEAPSGFVLMTDGVESQLLDLRVGACAPAAGKMLEWLEADSEQKVEQCVAWNIREMMQADLRDDCTVGLIARPVHRE